MHYLPLWSSTEPTEPTRDFQEVKCIDSVKSPFSENTFSLYTLMGPAVHTSAQPKTNAN